MRLLKRFSLIFFILIPFGSFIEAIQTFADTTNQNTGEHKIIGRNQEANVTLFAIEKDWNLSNFKLQINEETYFFPRWSNVANPTYYPDLYYSDINKDGKKELIIALTTGTGSEIIIQEVHVFQVENNRDLLEVLVDNPMAIINKNVKLKSTKSDAFITIDNKITKISIKELGIVPSHIYKNISVGSILKYKVINNKLVAIVGLTIAPSGGYLGEIHIFYKFKDNMYQAEKITFIPRTELR